MTLFFLDVNVWLALSVEAHAHNKTAWNWLRFLPSDAQLIFSRPTQVGLLRLLTNSSVMGTQTKTLGEAWAIHDQWMEDPRVSFFPEPRDLEKNFRRATAPASKQPASKLVGDCYLLAFAVSSDATLVTLDNGLLSLARKLHFAAISP